MNNEDKITESGVKYFIGYILDPKSNEIKNTAVISGVKKGSCENVVLPDELDGCPVTHVGYYPYWEEYPMQGDEYLPYRNPEERSCGVYARRCTFTLDESLKSIYISKNVTNIGNRTFSEAVGLQKLEVDPENRVFYSINNCILTRSGNVLQLGCASSVIPTDDKVTRIGYQAFAGQKTLVKIDIPDNIEVILPEAFGGNHNLRSVSLSKNLRVIEREAFFFCAKLEAIELPSNLRRIESRAFYSCSSLAELHIPENIVSLGYIGTVGAVYNEVKNGAGIIEEQAFAKCESLQQVFLPGTLKALCWDVFGGCTQLTQIHFDGSIEDWNKIKFEKRIYISNPEITSTVHCTDGILQVVW